MGAFVHMVLLPELLFYQGFSRFLACCYRMSPAVTSTRDGASQPRGISSGTYVFQGFCRSRPGNPPAPRRTTRGAVETPQSRLTRNVVFPMEFQSFCSNVTKCYQMLPPALRELLFFPRIFKVFYMILHDVT